MKLATILLMFAALTVLPPVARAQDASSAWSELSDDQRALLAPFEERWDGIPVERRQDILDGMRRWQAMTPEQQEQARRRFDEWNKL
ncbi:MAG: DUF3106 domain-containing protein, partial [Pseudomonadota bacterium]|nr:DUF3106 domain-containing protein [Pseudomonadota bacterium]